MADTRQKMKRGRCCHAPVSGDTTNELEIAAYLTAAQHFPEGTPLEVPRDYTFTARTGQDGPKLRAYISVYELVPHEED